MKSNRLNVVAVLIIGILATAESATASQKGENEYDRGCKEAGADVSYCTPESKAKAEKSVSRARSTVEWSRGCREARRGSYDGNKHSMDYEAGWQICNRQSKAQS